MKRAVLILALLGASAPALAQYEGPAVETCRAYAKDEITFYGSKAADVVFKRDQALTIERYTRDVGNQFVSSVLMGNGVLVMKDGVKEEQPFICLLANDKRAVFFYWLPRAP